MIPGLREHIVRSNPVSEGTKKNGKNRKKRKKKGKEKKMLKKVFAFFVSAVMVTVMAQPSMAATKLDTPTGLYWDGDKETRAAWEEVEHATGYKVFLFRKSDSDTNIIVSEVKTKKTTYDFSRKMDQEGEYVFKVRALGRNNAYTDSSWSADSDTTYVSASFAQGVKEGVNKQASQTSGPGAAQEEQDGTAGQANAQDDSGTAQPGWRQDDKGWWYATQANGSTWYSNCWQWLDENQDGLAECYCFDDHGYIYADTTTPEGYTVNADGAWTVDGVVQTKLIK